MNTWAVQARLSSSLDEEVVLKVITIMWEGLKEHIDVDEVALSMIVRDANKESSEVLV
uniref:Uncharacterized protein n=1 Tax=viral metagenome TaxID=1070528 RepID=A0A6M3IIQ6_9ZZZZ